MRNLWHLWQFWNSNILGDFWWDFDLHITMRVYPKFCNLYIDPPKRCRKGTCGTSPLDGIRVLKIYLIIYLFWACYVRKCWTILDKEFDLTINKSGFQWGIHPKKIKWLFEWGKWGLNLFKLEYHEIWSLPIFYRRGQFWGPWKTLLAPSKILQAQAPARHPRAAQLGRRRVVPLRFQQCPRNLKVFIYKYLHKYLHAGHAACKYHLQSKWYFK
jgi:hypothetical protein